ncbi:excinuclease ABC subunit UvrC [Candidatus Peregrinibacteria bacterium]|nr:excinuclease ABC subunit UvrC [Candidatus Peregrinibacteria bacterium]
MKIRAKIKKLLSSIPASTGVYQFIDKEGEVIYVGKAINLKKRVKSYFQRYDNHSVRIQKLVQHIHDIHTTVVGSELEAILLETNLIKERKPKYNILMKDDKNFVYIKITKNEDFPRISVVRKVEQDGALYFGPKTAASKVKKTLNVLKKIFPYRHCNLELEQQNETVIVRKKTMKYPCLDYHIKRCVGPCINKCTKEEYHEIIEQIIRFLKGNTEEIIETLNRRMNKAARNKQFEKAAKLRDKLYAIKDISEKQIISSPKRIDIDSVQCISQHGKAFVTLFMIRDGKLINQENFILKAFEAQNKGSDKEEIITSFLSQYYAQATDFPKQIISPVSITDSSLHDMIASRADQTVTIIKPQRGEKKKILDLTLRNVKNFVKQNQVRWQSDKAKRKKALQDIAEALQLDKKPKRIECFDISHLGGTNQVASMVVFENGIPIKKQYKRFKIKTVEEGKPDDFAAMMEVIKRRSAYLVKSQHDVTLSVRKGQAKGKYKNKVIATAKLENNDTISVISSLQWKTKKKKLQEDFIRLLAEKAKKNRVYIECLATQKPIVKAAGFRHIKKIPDELSSHKKKHYFLLNKSAYKKEKGFTIMPDLIMIDGGKGQLSQGVSVLKEHNLDIPLVAIAKKFEHLFIPGRTQPIIMEKTSEGLYLLQQIRDEAHRFAINYNKKLRSKTMFA